MELIRDQGFREQRGEYGSRVGGGDSLDVSLLIRIVLSVLPQNSLILIVFMFVISGSSSTVCCRNCYWQKRRNDQENTERHGRQNSV